MVETFYQSMVDGVVGSRADALGTKEMHELLCIGMSQMRLGVVPVVK